jgi:hypothetical protein
MTISFYYSVTLFFIFVINFRAKSSSLGTYDENGDFVTDDIPFCDESERRHEQIVTDCNISSSATGAGHRSDRCGAGSKPRKFPLCVLVGFGSEGCVLVPRSSGTPVATWAWPTWVVSRRRVLEAVFVLLESPSPSRRIFIGSHSLPPLWFPVSVLHNHFPLFHYGDHFHEEARSQPSQTCCCSPHLRS